MSTAITRFDFHGDRIDVATTPDGEHWAVLARLCEPFNLNADGQRRKLLALPWAGTKIILVPSAGGIQETFCLNLRSVAGWLFTINALKVAEHLRKKLATYQRECADVLADHFLGPRGAPSVSQVRADTIHSLVGDGTVGTNSRFCTEAKSMLFRIAEIDGSSFHKVHGELRRQFREVSYKRVRLPLWPLVKEWLLAELLTRPLRPRLHLLRPRPTSPQLDLLSVDADAENDADAEAKKTRH